LARKISVFGHIVTKEGISMDPAKVEAIVSWPRPINISEVRNCLGMAACFRTCIEGFSN